MHKQNYLKNRIKNNELEKVTQLLKKGYKYNNIVIQYFQIILTLPNLKIRKLQQSQALNFFFHE